MNLRELQKNWNRFGKEDPLWAISTVAEKKGNKWELDKFFETGAKEIAEILDHTSALGMAIDKHKALDFGCGVGRLTQAMATHFEEVAGVDIAPSMLKLARKYNRFGERCTYYRNQAADLRLFADNTFDFIYTNMVLQHMRPSYAKTYIREFLRVATPRGVIVFQLAGGELPKSTKPEPSPVIPQPQPQGGAVRTIKDLIKSVTPLPALKWYLDVRYGQPIMEMYSVTKEEVEAIVQENSARILEVRQDDDAGPGWLSLRFIVTK